MENPKVIDKTTKRARGQALEEAFFYRMDQELIAVLGKRLQREEKIRSFAQATGIQDKRRLEALVDSDFELSTLTAFLWVPLVFVAWADGNVDELEKKAISEVLRLKGISEETTSMLIAHEWFRRVPNDDLWQIWEEFIDSNLSKLAPTVRNELMDEIIGLCHVVAHASGGFLGMGKISAQESNVIDRVSESLHRLPTE